MCYRFLPTKKSNSLLLYILSACWISPCQAFATTTTCKKSAKSIPAMSVAATTCQASTPSPKVAVIGAGAAGLAAARILLREGYIPTVLEKNEKGAGGVWRYTKGNHLDATGPPRHPMYRGLRTNLPKEIMAFRDFPFQSPTPANPHGASFVTHAAVLEYLLAYKDAHNLDQYIQYGCPVKHLEFIEPVPATAIATSILSPETEPLSKIRVEWENAQSKEEHSDIFDAVFVCNGHYGIPFTPDIQGLRENLPKQVRLVHAIDYDTPEGFEDQVVLCVGGKASGSDLARDISSVAKHVYLSDNACTKAILPPDKECNPGNNGRVTIVPGTKSVLEDGSIQFSHDCPIRPQVDVIVFCTGYDFSFPFINNGIQASSDDGKTVLTSNLELRVVSGERRVMPLFEQLWHAHYPNIAFVGLPYGILPFPIFELQVEAVIGQWPGRHVSSENATVLPDRKTRIKAALVDATSGGAKKSGRIQDTHILGGFQWEYCRRLAKWANIYDERLDAYLRTNEEIYNDASRNRDKTLPGESDWYREVLYERKGWDQWKVIKDR